MLGHSISLFSILL